MSVDNNQQGFSLMELLLVLALVSVMLAMAVPTWRQHQLAAGRQQAWLQLQRIGLQQEHYIKDIGLASLAAEPLRYDYQVHLSDVGILLSAMVNANGPQSHDELCWRLTLSDTGEMKSLGKGGENQLCK